MKSEDIGIIWLNHKSYIEIVHCKSPGRRSQGHWDHKLISQIFFWQDFIFFSLSFYIVHYWFHTPYKHISGLRWSVVKNPTDYGTNFWMLAKWFPIYIIMKSRNSWPMVSNSPAFITFLKQESKMVQDFYYIKSKCINLLFTTTASPFSRTNYNLTLNFFVFYL